METFIQNNHTVKGLDAVADAFSGTVYSDILNMSGHGHCTFIVHKGVGATGTSTITVEACDDTSGSNVSAVPFFYKKYVGSDDVPGALTKATTAGFTTTAGSSQLYLIEVRDRDLASSGYKYVRLKAVEVVDSPVLGGIIAVLSQPRQAQDIPSSVIV